MTYILIIEKGTTNAMAVFMIIKCKEFDLIGMQLWTGHNLIWSGILNVVGSLYSIYLRLVGYLLTCS